MSETPADDALAILPAALSDSAEVAQILAGAFANDEHTVGLLPTKDDQERLALLRRMFDILVSEAFSAGGHVWMAVDATSGAPLGAALWTAPGRVPPLRRRLAHALPYARVFGPRFRDALRTDKAAAAHRPQVPHWYLMDLGASPEARGRGVGSALLRHRLADADSEGIGTYLESSSRANVGYYRRFGFIERGTIPAHGTTDLIGMWRPPAGSPTRPVSVQESGR